MTESTCGRIGRNTLSYCAVRAAAAIISSGKIRAVCLDPDGLITTDPVASSIDGEIVGVYTPDARLLDLSRRIKADIREARRLRKIEGGKYHRHRVAPGRKAA